MSLREVLRFFRKRGADLEQNQLMRLIESILEGPPREMYRSNLTERRWEQRRDLQIVLRLHKLIEGGVKLPPTANESYNRIQAKTGWRPRVDRSEEFVFSVRSGPPPHRFGDTERLEDFDRMNAGEFVQWAIGQAEANLSPWESGGGWYAFVNEDFISAVRLLRSAAERGVWAVPPWYGRAERNRATTAGEHGWDTLARDAHRRVDRAGKCRR